MEENINTNTLGSASTLPTLSVILCINRNNPWLLQALESVLTQDDTEFEFLIAANACSDELWDWLCDVLASDKRVRLFRTSIGQLAFNLNFLANQACGDYLIRMDSDDVCEPHRLRTLRHALAQDPVDILGSAALLIDADGQSIGQIMYPQSSKEISRALLSRTAFCHPTVAIRRAFLLEIRGYLGGFTSEDADLWLRANRAGARMRNLPQVLLRYRVHANQSTASRAGYPEVAAHWLRELLLYPNWYNVRGFAISLTKAIFSRFLPGVGRYRHKQHNDTLEKTL